jgi:hypothetical protein
MFASMVPRQNVEGEARRRARLAMTARTRAATTETPTQMEFKRAPYEREMADMAANPNDVFNAQVANPNAVQPMKGLGRAAAKPERWLAPNPSR